MSTIFIPETRPPTEILSHRIEKSIDGGKTFVEKINIAYDPSDPAAYDQSRRSVFWADPDPVPAEIIRHTAIHNDNISFISLFNTDNDPDADFTIGNSGDDVGTLIGGATVSGGFLNTPGAGEYVEYSSFGGAHLDIVQQVTIRVKAVPSYNGAAPGPLGGALAIISDTGGTLNNIFLYHDTDSVITFLVRDFAGANGATVKGPTWVAVDGVSTEIEANINFTTGEAWIGIDGVVTKTPDFPAITRTPQLPGNFRMAQFRDFAGKFDDVVLFNAIQHQASYTPTAVNFSEEDPYTYVYATPSTNAMCNVFGSIANSLSGPTLTNASGASGGKIGDMSGIRVDVMIHENSMARWAANSGVPSFQLESQLVIDRKVTVYTDADGNWQVNMLPGLEATIAVYDAMVALNFRVPNLSSLNFRDANKFRIPKPGRTDVSWSTLALFTFL